MPQDDLSLVCRVSSRLCALPLAHVVETMRPLPVEPLPHLPRPVRGVAIIRGAPVPVVDVAWIGSAAPTPPTRFVTVSAAGRHVALAVDAVVGIRVIPAGARHALPPLLRDAAAEAIAAIGTLDTELLIVLQSARLVPDTAWGALDAGGGPAAGEVAP